jgi:membrane protease YdiL (CAAX protease family)
VQNNSTWAPSVPSPIAWPREAWNPWFTALAFAGGLVVFVVAQTADVVVAAKLHALDPNHLTNLPVAQTLILQFVSWGAIAAYFLLVLPYGLHVPLSTLGFRAPTAHELNFAVVGALAMCVIVNGTGTLTTALSHRHDTEAALALLHQLHTPLERIGFVVFACGVAPFCEELVFRAFVFSALSRYFPFGVALVVSGALFGVLHVTDSWPGELLTVGLPLALGGVLLAYVYAKTRCFWANVITHALFNAVGVVGVMVFHVS